MLNFTAWPEMLAWPYLMLQGWLPYRDIAIAHSPLLLLDLVIFYKIFGIGVMQLKIYTWILIACNIYLTYFVGRKFWSNKIAILSSLLYLVLCVVYEGNGLWFDLALTPFVLLLYLFVRRKNYVWAGVIFALGLLTKQTFIWFAIPVLLSKINLSKFISGGLVVGLIFGSVLLILGIFDDFYYWAIKFGLFYLPSADGQVLLPTVKQAVFALAPFGIFIFNGALLPWAIVGALGVYPRWELFHFQPALPFISIALASFIFSKRSLVLKVLVSVLCILYLVYGLNRQLGNKTRFIEPEVYILSESVEKLNLKEIYVINYWDNIYALTNTMPATKPLIPYIPWYLEYANNKEVIINDLKLKMPKAIVIGERDKIFPELYTFIDRYYSCSVVDKKVELCEKN